MKPSSARILALLRERGAGGITDRDALLYAHTSRLAARIHDLRWLEGFDITSTLETLKAPAGVRIARYVLHEAPEQLSFDSQHTAPLAAALPPAPAGRGGVLAAEGLSTAGSRSR